MIKLIGSQVTLGTSGFFEEEKFQLKPESQELHFWTGSMAWWLKQSDPTWLTI